MKIHLYHCEVPMTTDAPIKTACGERLAHATPVYFIDYAICDIAYSLTGICGRCRKVNDRKRYLYGVTEAQEARLAGKEVEQEIRIGEA